MGPTDQICAPNPARLDLFFEIFWICLNLFDLSGCDHPSDHLVGPIALICALIQDIWLVVVAGIPI